MQELAQKVIDEIHELKRNKEPIHTYYIEHNHPRLYRDGLHCFKTWGKAVSAAGYDYSKVKVRDFIREEKWTDELIIDEVLRLYNAGVNLSVANIRPIYPAFFDGARRKLGTWSAVVGLAGIDYKEFARHVRITDREKDYLFLDYLKSMKKRNIVNQLAPDYGIGYATAKTVIRERSKACHIKSLKEPESFLEHIIEVVRSGGSLETLSFLEREILTVLGYEIVRAEHIVSLQKRS